ncbi:MAG: sigma 54-interacting transcriptional regulator [Deltaproteobacteria bacterium]|nr:sigma 54-interacting transcriptional regulator [Deltaproteobacteria bacterium]
MSEDATLTTRLLAGPKPCLELDRAELEVLSGPDRGLRFPLGPHSVRIGSSRRCELVLHDPSVSSIHAELELTEKGYLLRDRDSRNGTRIGSWQIREAWLAAGMRIRLGQTELLVHALGGLLRIELVEPTLLHGLVAHSVQMRAVAELLTRLAATDVTVLIEGESGTGKEVTAQALHALSPRAAGPFVVADCGAIPASLFPSEFFGYERGAFTGAERERAGLFEEARGGTLFLDEIGEIPLEQQSALLGVLSRNEVRRLGSQKATAIDIRLVAATNRNLKEEIRAGRFREDLYYRIAVGLVHLPPLRERREDLPPLARRFAEESGALVTEELLRTFLTYRWPGNVRELKNAIATLAVTPEALQLGGRRSSRFRRSDGTILSLAEARDLDKDSFEREYLAEVITLADGNYTRAAELAQISRVRMMQLAGRQGLLARDLRRLAEEDPEPSK